MIDCSKQLLAWQLIFLTGKGKIDRQQIQEWTQHEPDIACVLPVFQSIICVLHTQPVCIVYKETTAIEYGFLISVHPTAPPQVNLHETNIAIRRSFSRQHWHRFPFPVVCHYTIGPRIRIRRAVCRHDNSPTCVGRYQRLTHARISTNSRRRERRPS